MADTYFPGETVIEIPIAQCVKKTCFALDIGGSLFKLAYIIADKDSDTGHLHLVTFQISETDHVIKRLKQIFSGRIQSGDVILSTGFAAQRMKSQISEELDICLESRWEMDFFDYTLKYFLRHFTEEEMTEQKSPEFVNILAEAVNSCQAMVEAKRKVAMDMNIKCKLWGDFPEDVEQDLTEYEKNKRDNGGLSLPCLMVAVGSGSVITKIDRDGTMSLIGISSRSGAALLGLGSLLTGAQRFDELIELASSGDVGNVCTMGKHMKPGDVGNMSTLGGQIESGPQGLYNHFPDEHILFCFSQAAGKTKDDFSREDLASALLWTLSTDLALALYFACQANNIRDVYFAGSMTGHSQLVREYLEKAFILTQHNSGQVYRIRSHFMKYGPYYGAIGALLMNMEGNV